MNSGISCRNLSFTRNTGPTGNRVILNNITATFKAGKVNIISGAIGTGKSTLLNILAGLLRPTTGEVLAGGQAVSRWSGMHRDRWRRKVGIVFQHYHLQYDFTVLENVMLPLVPMGYSLNECRRRGEGVLQQMQIMHLAGSLVNTLSGGERQRTAIARSLINRPLYLFADEPTAHQDQESAKQVMKLMEQSVNGNTVVIVATHETGLEKWPGSPVKFRLDKGSLFPETV